MSNSPQQKSPHPLQIVECPRDAMQGLSYHVPTPDKIAYAQALLAVGYDTLDVGSFVSPKAIPQMADTKAVLDALDTSQSNTQLLTIVANKRGAVDACAHEKVDILGYPFSLSNTFQERNTRRSLAEAVPLVDEIWDLAQTNKKELVIYLSMGFGNPYGDPWSPEIATEWAAHFIERGIQTIALADTVGTAESADIQGLFHTLISQFPDTRFGAHFHATPTTAQHKIRAAWEAGCRRFDVAMLGFGGCPFAEDDLVGNVATESLLSFCEAQSIPSGLDLEALQKAQLLAQSIFAPSLHKH